MSSQAKAEAFADEAKKWGWTVEITVPAANEVHVKVDRNDEQIHIFWVNNMLTETPKYTFAGRTTSLHNKATATRQLSLKPDLARAYRRAPKKTSESGEPKPIIRHTLPFDIHEDTDATILKALRGSTIVYLNSWTQQAETAYIPYKVQKGDSRILMNTDLEDVFYLAANSEDKAYVSFMDPEGVFRAVYLEAILDVR